MPISEDNQAIVDAINKRIGSFNTIYFAQAATILLILALSVVNFDSKAKSDDILMELVQEVKLNSNNRTTSAVLEHSVKEMSASYRIREDKIRALSVKLDRFIDAQNEFNQRHSMVLDDAKNYINQNPIELLRKGK